MAETTALTTIEDIALPATFAAHEVTDILAKIKGEIPHVKIEY